jgi:hypothetical protein
MSIQDFPEERGAAQQKKWEKVRAQPFLDDPVIRDRLGKMIEYGVSRVDYYENLRHRYLTIGLGLFAGGIAFGALLARAKEHIPHSALLWGLFSMLAVLLTGLILLIYYNLTTAKEYAYRVIADIRSWYFRYHLPSNRKLVLSKNREKAVGQAREMTTALEHFLNRWLEFASEKGRFIAEDLEQVFILFVLQRYKYQVVNGMSRVLTVGVSIAILFFVVAALKWTVG